MSSPIRSPLSRGTPRSAANVASLAGAFVTLPDLDFGGKVADETINLWLRGMDMDTRRSLVETLYQILETSQGETLDGLILHWYESAISILDAVRDLDADARKNIRVLLTSLFGASAISALRSLLPGLVPRHRAKPETPTEWRIES